MDISSNLVIHRYPDIGGMGYMCTSMDISSNLVIHRYSDIGGMGYMCASMDEPWISLVTWSSTDTLT